MDLISRRLRERGEEMRRQKKPRTPTRVYEEAKRDWEPEQKCPSDRLDAILDMVIEMGAFYQKELVERVMIRFDIPKGTAAANVSAALLAFNREGWVAVVAPDQETVWKVVL